MNTQPKSLTERVRDSEARVKENGGRRIPCGMLDAEATEALDFLVSNGYAAGMVATIRQSLIDAAAKQRRRRK